MTAPHPHKARQGLSRLWHATGYSLQGLHAGWQEKAFRLEVQLSILLLPAAFLLGQNWVERMLLAGSVLLVLIVELLNSGIEAAIDRIGPELHPLSKKAKDLGGASELIGRKITEGKLVE